MARAQRRDRRHPHPRAGSPSGAAGNGQIQRAYRHWPAWAVFLSAAVVGALADLLTKHCVFAALLAQPGHAVEVIPGVLNFRLSTNPGVVFGIGMPPVAILLATAGAVVAAGALFAGSARRSWGLHLALGVVLAGALGNAYDRLFSRVGFPGRAERLREVRDFIDLHAGRFHWPTFNVADVLLVVGVAVILLHALRHKGSRQS